MTQTQPITLSITPQEANFLMRCLVQNFASTHEDFQPEISNKGLESLLVSKLIQADGKLQQVWSEARTARWNSASPLDQHIFWGNGWHSTVMGNNLHRRLYYAFGVSGGMQQNGGMGTEWDEKSDREDKKKLIAVVQDVMTALDISKEEV